MKKLMALLLAVFCAISCVSAASYTDVTDKTSGHAAISALGDMGVITGFPDGTFRPDDPITRAESAAVIVRMADYATDDTASSYTDVADSFWGKPYIMAATREGVLNGMGGGLFAPQDQVTYAQIVKMLVCVVGAEEDALQKGGWPTGYLDVALEQGIITNIQHHIISVQLHDPAPRADVAKYVYAAWTELNTRSITVAGQTLTLGQSADQLPAPAETVQSTCGWTWQFYGTDTYEAFYAVGVRDGKVVSLCAEGSGFVFGGYKAGDVITQENEATLCLSTDGNDGSRIHGVWLSEDSLMQQYFAKDSSPEALYGESRLNFHCANAFRRFHGRSILTWSGPSAEAARLHSQDMADQNYFQHDSLDGTKFYVRMRAQGVSYGTAAENIAAGSATGYTANDSWINSIGHRTNMLKNDLTHLGVGGGYHKDSQYKIYFTQDFFG